MPLGLNMSLGSGGTTPLQRALGARPNAQVYSRFDNKYGAGGLYYTGGALQTFADAIATPPAGEPTSAGMLVDGSDAPTLVQGRGPELWQDQDVTHIPDHDGSDGRYDHPTRTMSNVAPGPFGYPRFQFYLGMAVGALYDIQGRLSGNIGKIAGIRLATSGSANNISYNPVTGTFSALQIAGSEYLEFYGDGSLFSVTIEELSARRVLPYPGYDEDEQTISLAWDANGVTGDRHVFSLKTSATNRIDGHFASGVLRLEAFTGDVSRGAATVLGKDDGGSHSAIFYINRLTRELAQRVDGGAEASVIASAVPVAASLLEIAQEDGSSQFNGYILEHAAANGNQAWT